MSKNEIEIDDLEDNEDCECDLGCEENEDYFDDDEPKKKSKKATEKTLDDHLATLRKLFDNVEYEVLPYETQPNMIIDIKGSSRSYCRILCQKETGFINNKNSNIKHVNWLELQIRNENDWPAKHVKYIIDNYQLLKDENISFFAKDNPLDSIDMRKGLNYYLLYKSRKHNPIPSFNEMMKLRKTTLQHIFQNGLYEENNPRIDSFDGYDFEGYSFKNYTKDFMDKGATDIELVDVFGMRLQMGVSHLRQRYDGEEYQSFPYWSDGKGVNDSGNNIEYFYEESVFNKDYISWLREFTGWKTKTYGSFDDEVAAELIEVLALHHQTEEDEVIKMAKQSNDCASFQKELNNIHSESNGGGGGGQYMCLFGRNYERTKTGLIVSLSARKSHLQHYEFWNSDTMTKNKYGDSYYVFEGNAYQKVWQHYYSKIKHLDLFSMYDLPSGPSNNMGEKRKATQLSLFECI